ncbi:MAG: hypothetical protein FGM49_03140 [Candidatus Nanopelagicaceae bacterium]|nr:hypothetical protein [Candidatus Nanopelagicaceae bacterium]
MTNLETFRPRSGYIMAFGAFFAISALVYINIIDYGFRNAASSIAWGLVVCSIFYIIFIHPKVIFFDEGLLIINPLHSYKIGWHEIREIDVKFTMFVIHEISGAKIHVFVAPAPGRYHARTIHASEMRGIKTGDSGTIKAGESPRSTSGLATAIARTKFDQFQRFNSPGTIDFEYNFNKRALYIFSALLVVAVIAQILHP